MRVVVLGAGAIGSLVGARLALAGHEVALVGRGPLVAAVNAGGIELKEPGRACRADGVRASSTVAEALAGPPFDLGVVSVKAYDTGSLIAELRSAGAAIPPLLTLQNGVGNEEQFAAAFGPERVVAGTIETPVSAPRPGAVTVHRGRYGVGLAPVGTGAPVGAAAAALRDAGFRVETFDDYRSLKWTKLLMNMLANAGAAILDWSPAQVMKDPAGRALEGRAWQEALRVMKRRQIEPVALNGYPLRAFAPVALRLPPASSACCSAASSAADAGANRRRCTWRWRRGSAAKWGG